MSKLFYFLATFAHSGLSVLGLRGGYEQPSYRVVRTLAPDIEIRAYAPRTVVETAIADAGEGAAFGRLFRYITGANTAGRAVAGGVVERAPRLIAMTVPVELSGGMASMRFVLPAEVARAGAPVPTEAGVRVVGLPAMTLGVVRFSGAATEQERGRQAGRLRAALAGAGETVAGQPIAFSYDPPFTPAFLRRNEVAYQLSP
jgi:hypothetical protein